MSWIAAQEGAHRTTASRCSYALRRCPRMAGPVFPAMHGVAAAIRLSRRLASSTSSSRTPAKPAASREASSPSLEAEQQDMLAELARLRREAAPPSAMRTPTAASLGGGGRSSGSAAAARSGVKGTNDKARSGAKGTNDKGQIGPESPEYKDATRKWTAFIVAMPILLVTSYILFDRLALGNQKTDLAEYRAKLKEKSDREMEEMARRSAGENGGSTA